MNKRNITNSDPSNSYRRVEGIASELKRKAEVLSEPISLDACEFCGKDSEIIAREGCCWIMCKKCRQEYFPSAPEISLDAQVRFTLRLLLQKND